MASAEFTTEQVLELVLSLPLEGKREVMCALAADSQLGRDSRMALAETRMRQLAASRDLDWDSMTEDEREEFADNLVHEDRPCPQ